MSLDPGIVLGDDHRALGPHVPLVPCLISCLLSTPDGAGAGGKPSSPGISGASSV